MSHALLCFGSTFLAVFALGLQSLNVNQGHYLAAAGTSIGISLGHIALYKYMPGAGLVEITGYFAGGIAGIVSSMWFHRVVKAWWKRTASRREAFVADARRAPVDFFAGVGAELERWFQTELDRAAGSPTHPKCSRCTIGRPGACWRVDCPRHEISDTH